MYQLTSKTKNASLLHALWKGISLVVIILIAGCIICVFGVRVFDNEDCVSLVNYSAQLRVSKALVLDSIRGIAVSKVSPLEPSQVNSPDKQQYVFYKRIQNETDRYDLYIQSVDHQTLPRLLQENILLTSSDFNSVFDQIRWSRDSQQIAFVWENAQKVLNLTILQADGSNRKTVTAFAKNIAKKSNVRIQEWSADNQYISVIEGEIYHTHYSFWETASLEPIPQPLETATFIRGTWSPQGNLYTAILEDQELNPTHLVVFTLGITIQLVKTALSSSDIQHLTWSPDGKTILIADLASFCKETTCPSRWHYKLFQATDLSLTVDLLGTEQKGQSVFRGIMYGPDGSTVFSGYKLNATWSPDGQRFVYLSQHMMGKNQIFDLQAFDFNTQKNTNLASDLIGSFTDPIFHTNDNMYFSSRVLEPIPTFPISDQLIVPHWKDSKIIVEWTNTRWENPITLVSSADYLERLPTDYLTWSFWTPDWPIPNHILVLWSIKEGSQKSVKLTWANPENAEIKTLNLQLSDISNLKFLGTTVRPLVAFIGSKDQNASLYLLNLNDGKINRLLENIDQHMDWIMQLSPQEDTLALLMDSPSPTTRPVYIIPISDANVTLIDTKSNTSIRWSSDGEKLAIANTDGIGKQMVRIVRKNGSLVGQMSIGKTLSEFGLEQFSNCD